jgi:hypothetical protein
LPPAISRGRIVGTGSGWFTSTGAVIVSVLSIGFSASFGATPRIRATGFGEKGTGASLRRSGTTGALGAAGSLGAGVGWAAAGVSAFGAGFFGAAVVSGASDTSTSPGFAWATSRPKSDQPRLL